MRVHTFFESLPFTADPYQVLAAEMVEMGRSVVVTAPTGAGKTLIAEAAIHLSLANRRRVFYTTPLKALSNQKFRDFGAIHGSDRVGLLTGDNTINHDAPVVVMTTEVLRNMIYAGSDLSRVDTVVLDEVHYLQDRFRGAVWEEVIIHAPPHIRLVCLSATVSNAAEFTDWLRSRRGPTELIVEEHRPVRLERWWSVWDRFDREVHLLPLYMEGSGGIRPNAAIPRLLARRGGRRRRFSPPKRTSVVEHLAFLDLLPAIYFLFSRAGCDDAADQVVATGIRLTDAAERDEIRRRAEEGTDHLAWSDLRTLGHDRWLARLERGVAAHHAGLVPAFKEVVEQLFCDGLIKVVFATETLALGINMPARTVVLDRLSRFTGESHELLLPGEFTQLTGRAGRRGIDTVGHGVVLHSPFVPFERMASIARLGSHPLRSSFRPTYNMLVNLVANYSRRQAERLLAASFAEFQDRRSRRRSNGGARRSGPRRSSLLQRFDRARRLLEQRGHIRDWALEPGGEALRVVYNDLGLLLVEATRDGVFDGLRAPELVALVSTFAYEPRRDAEEPDGWPTTPLESAWRRLVEQAEDLAATEQHHGLPVTRFPHPGFAWLAYAWALRLDLEELLDEGSLAAGDFVRTTRSVLDLLRQVGDAARVLGNSDLESAASRARRAIDRGIVTAGGVV
ncbi:DEAD/DEAH box helicase [Candidatus Spongiisocius sp.]|uniref:DEAD/DEAH box helicase n=1 Tax=Candidatus Spongiisocius sp. TaxID=3101273 RepID=UPI003B5AEB3C